MSVELRHLRYFLALAEELHFGRAAESLGIAQPGLTQQIRRLEEEVGATLFHRTRRSVRLSAAGEAMIRPARQTLADLDLTVESARRADRGETGHLTIGFVESAASTVVPTAVRSFRDRHPGVGLSLRELSVDSQIDGLRSGRLDVGLVRAPVATGGLRFEALEEEPLIVAAPDSHPLARRTRIHPRTLAAEPLVLLAREVVPGPYDEVIALMRQHGDGAVIAQEATSIQAVLGLVAAGLGVSLLPASALTLGRDGVSFVELRPSPRSSILVAWRASDLSSITARFVAAARGGSR